MNPVSISDGISQVCASMLDELASHLKRVFPTIKAGQATPRGGLTPSAVLEGTLASTEGSPYEFMCFVEFGNQGKCVFRYVLLGGVKSLSSGEMPVGYTLTPSGFVQKIGETVSDSLASYVTHHEREKSLRR